MRQRPAIDQTTCELFVLLFVGSQTNWFLPASGGAYVNPGETKTKQTVPLTVPSSQQLNVAGLPFKLPKY